MAQVPKYVPYLNRKILDSARYQDCQHCDKNDGTTIAAHSNLGRDGKGVGLIEHRSALLKEAKDQKDTKIEQLRLLVREKKEPELPFDRKANPSTAEETTYKELKGPTKLLGPAKGHKRYKTEDVDPEKKKRKRKPKGKPS